MLLPYPKVISRRGSAVTGAISVERNLGIPMRDGVMLSGDLYRPSAPGRYPTLLQRTPYNKNASGGISQAYALRAAEAGYAVIVQDVRGRFNSSGEFRAFEQEQAEKKAAAEKGAAPATPQTAQPTGGQEGKE